MTEVARDLGLEEAKEQITARGRERGFVTSEDLLDAVPVDDFTPEQVRKSSVGPGTVRLSIGLEDVDDLIADIDQALAGS